jgi:hypothetical protein
MWMKRQGFPRRAATDRRSCSLIFPGFFQASPGFGEMKHKAHYRTLQLALSRRATGIVASANVR